MLQLLSGIICALLLSGCDDNKNQSAKNTAQEAMSNSAQNQQATQEESAGAMNLIRPNAELMKRLTLESVAVMPWRSQLKVSGSIDLDEKRVARIGSSVSGRVTEIKVLRGDRVSKGDVLALIHSSELAEAQMAYLKAFAVYDLAKKSAQRAQILFKEGVISSAEQQKRESERLSSEAEWSASKNQMQILGMSAQDIQSLETKRQISSIIALRSPIHGVVIDRKVSQGQVLEPADLAYSVADLSRVWAVGEVPERYSAQMHAGKQVQVIIPALANETRSAVLTYVSDTVTPQSRTLRVRAELDNADGRLKPEMLATLQVNGAPQERLVVPVQAVFREDNQDKVFVAVKEGKFRIQIVKLGEEENNFRPIEEGLSASDVIVTDGVFQLNADRLMKQNGD